MGEFDTSLKDVDYPWLMTIYEGLEWVITHCEAAENAQDEWTLELHLKMASRAMRFALEVFGEHVSKEITK